MSTLKLYDILGVNKNATLDEIKKKFKKLAVTHHPDKGGDTEKFKEITKAYDILSNEEKRNHYDMIGDDPNLDEILNNNDEFPFGMHGMNGMHFGGNSPFENIFQNLFNMGNNHRKKEGKNIEKNVKISIKDAYFGIKKKYDINITKYCDKCNQPCSECKGAGFVNKVIGNFGIMIQQRINCNTCKSKGYINKSCNNCNLCNGKGNYNVKENISIDIIPGVKTGMRIVVENKGDEILHVENNNFIHAHGDLILNIIVDEKDEYFIRENDNLIYNITLPYWKLLTHIDHIIINHYKDNNLKIDFQEPINHNKIYIFKKLGMPIVNSGGNHGDLLIKFNILFPDNRLQNNKQEQLLLLLKELDILN
jgi:DnaJ family protein A protein 2